MKKKQFISILDRYLKQEATADELNLLHAYYHLFMADSDVLLLLSDYEQERLGLQIKTVIDERIGERFGERFRESPAGRFEERIGEGDIEEPVKTTRLWFRIAGVAAAIAVITAGIWLYNSENSPRHPEQASGSQYATDIAPGKNTATLIFAGGKTIKLSDEKTGVVVNASGLKYNDNSDVDINGRHPELVSGSGKASTLTITTPRGGTYQVTLPDGTKAWLNAASQLTYTIPANVRGGIRKVDLVGEAYFEVFRNKNQPFVVNSKNLTTTVLGTHFNISSYMDESGAKATLLEGSVRLSLSGRIPTTVAILKPNQQGTVTAGADINVKDVDAQSSVAWKNGEFIFKGERIADIMRTVQRWYDVEVVFENNRIAEKTFTADISRYDNISKLLSMLQKTGKVKFRIEGRTVYVSE